MKRQQSGFTLIELIIVIVILGILAITAAPRFFNFGSDARASTLNGLKGALETATSFTYSKAVIAGKQSLENICFNTSNQSVAECVAPATANFSLGYPLANSELITAILDLRTGTNGEWIVEDSTPAGSVIIRPAGYTPSGTDLCEVRYTPPSSAGNKPTIQVTSTGC
jgi:MSHA pilin protein MshA